MTPTAINTLKQHGIDTSRLEELHETRASLYEEIESIRLRAEARHSQTPFSLSVAWEIVNAIESLLQWVASDNSRRVDTELVQRTLESPKFVLDSLPINNSDLREKLDNSGFL
jgi:hypothetical protein